MKAQYDIIQGASIDYLKIAVNNAIADGWHPIGGITIYATTYPVGGMDALVTTFMQAVLMPEKVNL